MNFFASLKNYIITKKAQKQKVFIPTAQGILIPFCFYYATYPRYMKWGWKHDPNPLDFIIYSDKKYTHGINLHYLDSVKLNRLFQAIDIYYKNREKISWYIFYHSIFKIYYGDIIKTAYRCYMSFLIKGYVVANGIYPTDRFTKIYNSNNYILNQLQIAFNKKYNLVSQETIQQQKQTGIVNKVSTSFLEKAKQLFNKG